MGESGDRAKRRESITGIGTIEMEIMVDEKKRLISFEWQKAFVCPQ